MEGKVRGCTCAEACACRQTPYGSGRPSSWNTQQIWTYEFDPLHTGRGALEDIGERFGKRLIAVEGLDHHDFPTASVGKAYFVSR